MADLPVYDPKLFQTIEKIGSGSYGSVFKAKEIKTGRIVALKAIELEEGDSMADALVEIQVLKDCDCDYVTRYLSCYRQGFDKLYVAMELCELGSIISTFPKLKIDGLPEPAIAYVIFGTLKGLEYMHKRHKIHRDIKGGNILVNNKGEIKLADFGITAMLNKTWGRRNTFIGSPYWMAPEMALDDSYDKMVDIWATGITCIELAEGNPPNYKIKWQDAMKLMANSKTSPTLSDPYKWTPEFNDFIAQCLKKNPKERADIPQLLQHPFLAKKYAPLGPDILLKIIKPLIKK